MKIFLICLLFLLIVVPTSAQVLKSTVTVDFGLLPAEEVNNLIDLSANIEDYFNNFAWTDDEYETSGESFYDKEWEFPYQPGYLFDHRKIEFDPLCHFIDYYALLVLGGELDGYALNLGTPFYDEAQNLANIGLLSKYSKGWNKRLQELQKIMNVRTRPLREAKPDFFEAEYLLEEGKLDEAIIYALKVLDNIDKVVSEQPNNKYLRTFFDAHYVTFAKIFKGDKETLTRLIQYDSYHRETYREVLP
jgi:hypothetical protein